MRVVPTYTVQRGTWTVVNGITAHEVLSDDDDSTSISHPHLTNSQACIVGATLQQPARTGTITLAYRLRKASQRAIRIGVRYHYTLQKGQTVQGAFTQEVYNESFQTFTVPTELHSELISMEVGFSYAGQIPNTGGRDPTDTGRIDVDPVETSVVDPASDEAVAFVSQVYWWLETDTNPQQSVKSSHLYPLTGYLAPHFAWVLTANAQGNTGFDIPSGFEIVASTAPFIIIDNTLYLLNPPPEPIQIIVILKAI